MFPSSQLSLSVLHCAGALHYLPWQRTSSLLAAQRASIGTQLECLLPPQHLEQLGLGLVHIKVAVPEVPPAGRGEGEVVRGQQCTLR